MFAFSSVLPMVFHQSLKHIGYPSKDTVTHVPVSISFVGYSIALLWQDNYVVSLLYIKRNADNMNTFNCNYFSVMTNFQACPKFLHSSGPIQSHRHNNLDI